MVTDAAVIDRIVDGDLFVFFCYCKEAAGFIWEAGGAVRQDGIIV